MQGDNKKLNIPFIEKEIKNLYEEAFNEFIKKMKDLEKKKVSIEDIILDDDHNGDGSNTLRVYLQFENKYYDVSSDWNDLYRKHQLLGDGAEIDYDKKDIMKLKDSVETDINKPVQAPTTTTTTIPIEKEDIKRIISMLYSLTTYEYITSDRNNLSQRESDERTVSMFVMINKLLGLL